MDPAIPTPPRLYVLPSGRPYCETLVIKPLPAPFPWRRVVARFAGFVALVVVCCLTAVGCWRVP